MFGFVHCNASILARQNTDSDLFFVRILVKNWLWPIITLFGVTGNILAIIVLTKRRMIMSSTNNYLVALALVDIAYLVLTLILNTAQNPCFAGTTISNVLLVICRPIADFASNSSVWLTVTFTVERWVAITYPLQSRTWCTIDRARRIILSVMCASLLCTLPSAFEMKLVRIIKINNSSNETIYTSYIEAQLTALGNSVLYHKIYFNFVTFAIVWIPLVLLVIFNTILISYVRRSKLHIQKTNEGIHLRRHNRGSQGEQRKTTIMLIAVVIVFTVCQIPQAISLTLQSFVPKLAQTSKVLIYNNFANCLVAVNASINFVLYCCFSDRFRSIFRSNFTFISKYCAQYIQPEWTRKSNNHQHTFSNSCDNISLTNYSTHGNQIHSCISNVSGGDNNIKNLHRNITSQIHLNKKQKLLEFFRLQDLSPKMKSKPGNIRLKDLTLLQNIESFSSSPTLSPVKSSTLPVRLSHASNVSLCGDRTLKISFDEPISKQFSKTDIFYSVLMKQQSLSYDKLNRSSLKPKIQPKCYSYRSLRENNKDTEQIWIKRHRSEQLLDRHKSLSWNGIMDVTVL
ncbi:unnamed protein product [Adineta steineri]|uniref:G-protein coupled receptors family 1 profile domain-containing protein n=1 Tax=Adineta steineri TaxID=433720 RepID=A0A814MMF7_9BILA|nr:unnamed protein product [Adineta steineri]CAF3867356.1 unnamed protein product [Adineta steineri]